MTQSNSLKPMFPIVCALALASVAEAGNYHNFGVAVYARAYEVQQMKDPAWLESRWATVTNDEVDKIYLETHRDGVVPDQATARQRQAVLQEQGRRDGRRHRHGGQRA